MSNSLVPVNPIRREKRTMSANGRASANFVAHLIGTAAQAPQTRARRRAEPQDAVAAYRELGQRPSQPGRAVSRSL